MKREKKQSIFKLSICLFFIALFNVSSLTPVFGVFNQKEYFIITVRETMEATQNPGLSSKYFSVGDPDKLLAGVDQYVIGVTVDRDYLAHFNMPSYLKSFIWLQHPGQGLTQPRYEDAAWGDIVSTPQEKRYSGWIILNHQPDFGGGITAFHEAIHAYHLHLHSSADNDDYGAPENISQKYGTLIQSFRNWDKRLERILEKIKAGNDYETDLQTFRKAIILLEKRYKDFANKKFHEVLKNIGGRADWDGYRKAVNLAVDNAVAGAGTPQLSTSLKKQLEALKKRLAVVEGKIQVLMSIKTEYNEKQKSTSKFIKAHIDRAQKMMDEADAIAEEMYSRLRGAPASSDLKPEIVRLTQDLLLRTQEFETAYGRFAKAAGNANKTRDEICGYKEKISTSPPPSIDVVNAWRDKSTKLIEIAAIALKVTADEVSGTREVVSSAFNGELEPLLDYIKNDLTLFLAIEKTVVKFRKDMDDAEKELKAAREIREEIKQQLIRLAGAYSQDRIKAILEVRGIYDELNIGESTGLDFQRELENLSTRARSAERQIIDMQALQPPEKLPEVPQFSIPRHVRKLELDYLYYRDHFRLDNETITAVNQIIANGRNAISEAGGVLQAGRFATEKAPQILEEARQCYASLEKAKEAIQKTDENLHANAKAAIQTCRFEDAENLIKQMPKGTQKIELDGKYRQIKKQDSDARALFAEAQGLYRACDNKGGLNVVLTKLNAILSPCGEYRDFLNEKIERVTTAIQNQSFVESKFQKAQGIYGTCDYDKVITVLNNA